MEMYSTHKKGKSVVAKNFKNFNEENLQIHDLNIKNYLY